MSAAVDIAVSTIASNCTACQDCLQHFQALPAEARNSSDSFAVAASLRRHCLVGGFAADACGALEAEAAKSLAGNLAKRPAAVCRRLQLCFPGAQVCQAASAADDGVSGAMDECSATGLVSGPAVRPNGRWIGLSGWVDVFV